MNKLTLHKQGTAKYVLMQNAENNMSKKIRVSHYSKEHQEKYQQNKGVLKTVRKCINDKFPEMLDRTEYGGLTQYLTIFTEIRKNGALRSKYYVMGNPTLRDNIVKYVNKKFGKMGVKASNYYHTSLIIKIK